MHHALVAIAQPGLVLSARPIPDDLSIIYLATVVAIAPLVVVKVLPLAQSESWLGFGLSTGAATGPRSRRPSIPASST
ncbi:MAG TPA: hypothetical protein VKT80_15040 [Chloroflexota bacterium]|nr:hypothetical protein [Chloroflexota bacterium]